VNIECILKIRVIYEFSLIMRLFFKHDLMVYIFWKIWNSHVLNVGSVLSCFKSSRGSLMKIWDECDAMLGLALIVWIWGLCSDQGWDATIKFSCYLNETLSIIGHVLFMNFFYEYHCLWLAYPYLFVCMFVACAMIV